jgi:hypothetical protein
MINPGPWRCAAAEAATLTKEDCLAESKPLRRHHDG